MIAVLLLITLAFAGCTGTANPKGPRLVERTFASMGTELKLSAWTADEAGADAAFESVYEEMDRLEGLLSNWRSTSDVEQLNAAAGKHPVRADPNGMR